MAGMRRKTIVNRARIRISPQPSDSDDVNGASVSKGDDGTRHQSPEARDEGDSRRESSQVVGDSEAGNSVDRLLKSDACIVCDGEDNQVLVCHETGCPVSIHHSCMPDEPDFDEIGNFYCPYCWYKRLLVKSLKLREKVRAAEKCANARDVTVDGNDGRIGNVIEVNMALGRLKSLNPCENGEEGGELGDRCVVELEKSERNDAVNAGIRELEVSNNDERAQGQDSDVGEGRNRRKKSSDQRGRVEEEEEKCGDQSHGAEDEDRRCVADLRKANEALKGQDDGLREDDKAQPDHAPSISSPISSSSANESDTSDQEFVLVKRSKDNVKEQLTEARRRHDVASSSKKPLFEPEKFSRGNKSSREKNATECHDSIQRKDNTCSDRKRKRLCWTPEEEDMLRVGVEKFSKTANKNMPWRKVLEFGQNVFQEERTPADLKDKWRKMSKES